MFIKLLNEDEIKSCLDGIGKDTFKDGNKSQPLEDVKNNKESVGLPEEVRKLIINKIYDAHYIDCVYCPTRVSVNYYNQYKLHKEHSKKNASDEEMIHQFQVMMIKDIFLIKGILIFAIY